MEGLAGGPHRAISWKQRWLLRQSSPHLKREVTNEPSSWKNNRPAPEMWYGREVIKRLSPTSRGYSESRKWLEKKKKKDWKQRRQYFFCQSCAVVNQESVAFHCNQRRSSFPSLAHLKPERLSYEISSHTVFPQWKAADRALCWHYSIKISRLMSVWLLSCLLWWHPPPKPLTEREQQTPSTSWLHSWQKLQHDMDVTCSLGLRCVTPPGYEFWQKSFAETVLCTLCHSLRTQYLSYVIQQGKLTHIRLITITIFPLYIV